VQDTRLQAPFTPDGQGAGGRSTVVPFDGFDPPESNFWRLPNNWFDLAARFTSWSEQKVVEYILRHTWGYHEYGMAKLITMDEFMHGRKRRDGSRLDAGCGMAENSIKKGIQDAVAHGFLIVQTDDRDKGRIRKYYAPRMRRPLPDEGEHASPPAPQRLNLEGQFLTPQMQALTLEVRDLIPAPPSLSLSRATLDPRTEQATSERHLRQETISKTGAVVVPFSGSALIDQNLQSGKRPGSKAEVPSPTAPTLPRAAGAAHPGELLLAAGRARSQRPGQAPGASIPRSEGPLRADLTRRLMAEGIAPARARTLVAETLAETIERQLNWIGRRVCRDRAATLVRAIMEDFSEPARHMAPVSGPGADGMKYYRGSYALCPRCGARPCVAGCPGQQDHEQGEM
jgi:hypothetical protein